MIETTYRTARRVVVAIISGTVLLVGVAMIALPGPAVIVIPTGLAILGIEFAFARRWLRTLRERSKALYNEFVREGESNQNSISTVPTSKRAQ